MEWWQNPGIIVTWLLMGFGAMTLIAMHVTNVNKALRKENKRLLKRNMELRKELDKV